VGSGQGRDSVERPRRVPVFSPSRQLLCSQITRFELTIIRKITSTEFPTWFWKSDMVL
jgi:hypothetical protein